MPPENDVQAEIEQLEQRFAENSKGLVFAHLADAYRRAGQYAKAEGLILHGLKHHPSYTTAYNVLGRVYLDSERFADAHQQFSKVLELDPHNLIALRALGDLAVRGGRLDDARVWYERMLQVDPRNEEAKDELRKLEAGIAGLPPAAVAETPAATELGEPAAEIAEGEVELAELEAPEVEPSPEELAAIPEADVPESPPWEAAPEAALAEPTPSAEAEEASAPTAGAEPDEVAVEPRPEGPAHEPTMEVSPPESLEIELGDLDEWTPGFLRDEDLEGDGEAVAPDVLFGEAGGDLGPDVGDASQTGEADELGGGVVTETMAELYAEQGLYEDAIDVYRQLIEIRPNDERLWTRAAELQKLAETAAAGDTEEEVAELSELTEPAAAEPSELPDRGPQVPPMSAEGGFGFDDEAPVAGMEQLDPFAASFDVLATRAERAAPQAPELPFEPLVEVSEPEPLAPEEPEAVALEELREEVALEALQETPLSADVLPPGEEFTVPVEVETPMPPPASREPAVGVGQVAQARTIEDYLADLLAFNPEAATAAQSEGAEGAVDASSDDAPTSEDMQQFQAWLRSLKR